MKTYVLGLLFLGFTSLSVAQHELAFVTSSAENTYSKSVSNLNAEYLNAVAHPDISKKVEKLQNIVADYDIKASDVYSSNYKNNYTVNFSEGDNKITAIYNNKGNLLSCEEKYQGIKLPYNISSKLIKEYPNWSIKDVQCTIIYIKNKEKSIVYKVAINHGNLTKQLSIKV